MSCALLPLLLLAAEGATAGWVETQKLYGDDTDGGDRFGKSVAVDGATAIVGAEDKGDVAFFGGAPRTMEPGDRLSGDYQVTIPLETPPDTYELRVGVGEAENRIAGDRAEFEVVAAP